MIKSIIFDFDGVIVDTEIKKFNDIKKFLAKYDYYFENDDLKNSMGKKTRLIIKENFPDISDEILNKIIVEKRELEYQRLEEYKLIKGIKDLLSYIQEKNYKIGIVTGSRKKLVRKILGSNKLLNYFEFFVTGEDFDSSKPNPECFELMLDKMKLKPKDVIVIEDSIAGIKAAKSIGIKVFALTTYLKKSELLEADNQFNNHLDILEYLKTI